MTVGILFYGIHNYNHAETLWVEPNVDGQDKIHLYFFWTASCPHCLTARPFVEELAQRHNWLVLHSHMISRNSDAAQIYVEMAQELRQPANSVPAFLFCRQMEVGFGSVENSGAALEQALINCYQRNFPPHAPKPPGFGTNEEYEHIEPEKSISTISLPLFGAIEPQQLSLPVFTLIIAGLDAFNPCAFFVLLFLLSLLTNARSRGRMLFIGLVFLFFSGAIYFAFMAAWLNLFMHFTGITVVTWIAGGVAIIFALINIKDYFWFKVGVSLSIPEAAKPGLYQRIRALLRADNLPALTVGTIILAIAVNSYELLCTAGFPMVYTRILTLSELTMGQYYAYLLLYNVIYVIPLLIITLVFTFTMGSRKLSEQEGRLLKLVSGLMMLGLGTTLVLAPDLLNNLWTAGLLLLGALLSAWIIHRISGTLQFK